MASHRPSRPRPRAGRHRASCRRSLWGRLGGGSGNSAAAQRRVAGAICVGRSAELAPAGHRRSQGCVVANRPVEEPAGKGEGAMKKLIAICAFVMPFLLAPPALAAVEINEIQPLNDFEVSIPCADQTVTLNGSLHVLITFTINDVRLTGTDHFQPVRLTGVDSAGRTYRGVGITSDQFSASLRTGQFETSFRNNFFII